MLDHSLQFLFCNRAWDDFARQNGGTEAVLGFSLEGRRLFEFIPDILKPFFRIHMSDLQTGGAMWLHQYECSSPQTYRIYEMQAIHLRDEHEIFICHKCLFSHPHTQAPVDPSAIPHRQGLSQIRMCSHCRCTKRDNGADKWDWIPAFLATPPKHVIHDLCPRCVRMYYGDEAALHSFPGRRGEA